MKKKFIALILCTAVLLCGCTATKKITDTMKQAAQQAADSTATQTPEATATPGPVETSVALEKKGTVGNWKFCVKKATTKKTIKASEYMGFKPGKGNIFVVVTMTIENKGKKEDTALPSVGLEDQIIQSLLYHDGETEYKPTQLLSYKKDLLTKKIKPLSKKSGVVVYEVPKKVAKDMKKLTLKIGTSKESLIYTLK